jgi:bifunctional DNase/RNase
VERPLTHDLLKSVITELGGQVKHIVVSDLRQDTFYAQVVIEQHGGPTRAVDSRPSDAIALAVRLEVPIYVEETVMERASITPDEEVESEASSETPEKGETSGRLSIFEDFVESLDLDDLDTDEDEE